MDGALEDWFEATLRSSARGGMVLLDWPPPDHLGIGRKRGNSCQRKHPANPGTRLELRSHRRSSNANSLCSRNSAGSPEICATFQREILQQHF
jgi:hypothetical protein